MAIAEQHAVTLAAGMACEGAKPVVAIYSTFLQRGYDQLVHDVAVQNLDVLFAIDRAGLVGEDGPTHAGSYDLSYLRCIPGMLVMTPSDENELRKMLSTGHLYNGPAAVRYPRGTGPNAADRAATWSRPEIGKGVVRRQGEQRRPAGVWRAVGRGYAGGRADRRHGGRHALRQAAGRGPGAANSPAAMRCW